MLVSSYTLSGVDIEMDIDTCIDKNKIQTYNYFFSKSGLEMLGVSVIIEAEI